MKKVWTIVCILLVACAILSCQAKNRANDNRTNEDRANDNGKTVSKETRKNRAVDLWLEAVDDYQYQEVVSLFDELTSEDFEWLTTERADHRDAFSYDLNKSGDGVVIKQYLRTGEMYPTIIVPKIIEGYPVVAINRFINANQTNALTVVLPNTVKEILRGGSTSCIFSNYLTKINMPTSLEKLDGPVFAGSNIQGKIILPDSLIDLGSGGTFYKCTNITSVVFGNGIKRVPVEMFYGCESLASVTFSDSIIEMGEAVFEKSSIVYIALPKNLEILGNSFQWCDSLYNVELPSTLKYVSNKAFTRCTGLSVITIPDDLKTVEWENGSYSSAFTGCGRLTLSTRKRLQELGYQGGF